jgi:hypothetical protein
MATTGLMLQLEVEQQLSTDVSSINEIFAEAATFLNGGTVTVTEIAVQKMGGVFGNNIAIPIDDSPTGYVTLRVFTGGNNEIDFFAPSSVPSPPVEPGLAALLELRDAGFTAPQNVLQVARKLGAHVYLEET